MVVVASVAADREPTTALSETAREVDRRFRASFSLEKMLRRLVE